MQNGLIINGRFLQRRITGVERYAREVTRRLPTGTRVANPSQTASGCRGHLWEQVVLPCLVGKNLLWSPANSGPLLVERQVVTIHDTFSIDHPEWYRGGFAAWYRLLLPGLVHQAKHVVTVSEYSRRRIRELFHLPPEKITVAPAGVDSSVFHPLSAEWKNQFRAQLSLPKNYLLFLGSIEPRKNLDRLATAWTRVCKQFPDTELVIAGGSGPQFSSLNVPNGQQIRHLGYIPENCLSGLYSSASAFILPSLDEGFGLPALEAMACGTPVVASKAGALPEILGDAALLVDPYNIEAIASGIAAVLRQPEIRREFIQKGFARAGEYSWEKTTEVIHFVLAEVAAGQKINQISIAG